MDEISAISDYILLVGEAKGYLFTSIKNNLCEANFEVSNPSDDIAEISKIERSVRAILIYITEAVLRNQKLLVYLKPESVKLTD